MSWRVFNLSAREKNKLLWYCVASFSSMKCRRRDIVNKNLFIDKWTNELGFYLKFASRSSIFGLPMPLGCSIFLFNATYANKISRSEWRWSVYLVQFARVTTITTHVTPNTSKHENMCESLPKIRDFGIWSNFYF